LVACGIGGQTVQQISDCMTVDEFYTWQAYFEMYPTGNEDLQFALLRRTLYAVNASKQSQIPPLKKFMLAQEKPATAEEIEAKMNTIITGQ